MLLPVIAILCGLALLVWSADRFVEGAAATARHFGMAPLLIGMVIIGFGTSAPEMVVSAFASAQGNPAMALGNAYGSNITNIALILGLTALLSPIRVQSQILRKELPILSAATLLAMGQIWDGYLSRNDALILLAVFTGLIFWSIWQGLRTPADNLAREVEQELVQRSMPLNKALFWLAVGLLLLIASSRLLVWGAVAIAQAFGVSDLIIGLTIVAIGTSLPELAASILAVRKGEHDIALGNVIGSNLFNTMAVVGIAGTIRPFQVPPEVLTRDLTVVAGLTLSLFLLGYGFRRPGRINRLEGAALVACFLGYSAYLMASTLS